MTPATVTLDSSAGYFKGEAYTITFSKEGYMNQTVTLNSSIDGWYWGNIVFGGLLGMLIVDPATGAMYNLPERVDASLDASADARETGSLRIASVNDLTEAEKSRLVLISN